MINENAMMLCFKNNSKLREAIISIILGLFHVSIVQSVFIFILYNALLDRNQIIGHARSCVIPLLRLSYVFHEKACNRFQYYPTIFCFSAQPA